MAWQSYPPPFQERPSGGPPPHGPPPPPREGSPGRRSEGGGMHAAPSRATVPVSLHETEMMRPMPPRHDPYARGPPPPPRGPRRAPYPGESPPHGYYPPHYPQAPYPPRGYYGEPSPPRGHEEYDMDMRHSGGCTCKKSKCLKLYCQCFASSLTCGPRCKCQACHNTTMHGPSIEEARRVILERNPSAFDSKFVKDTFPAPPPLPHEQIPRYPGYGAAAPPPEWLFDASDESSPPGGRKQHKSGCKCRRSYCLKKYCECFHHGARCGDMCRCINCKNKPQSEQLPAMSNNKEGAAAQKVDTRMEVRVSQVGTTTQAATTGQDAAEAKSPEQQDQDRMAIMAAVAMTELFGGSKEEQATKPAQPMVRRVSEDNDPPPTKRLKMTQEPPKKKMLSPTSSEDEEVRAVVSSGSSHASQSPSVDSHGSRDPSPPPRFPHYYGYYNNYGAPPRGMGPIEGLLPPPPPHMQHYRRSPDGNLPKALSFRKICSKCGKTRGEHGELGFGNKCVYQDCGRCGAGVQMHVKASVPMGFLCTLTVSDGATPGAPEAYERKIHDLAMRAELQQRIAIPSVRRVKA